MANKKVILSIVAIFAALFLVSFASAGTITSASYSSTALHNSNVIVSFNVTYVGADDVSTYNFSKSSSSVGNWVTLPGPTPITNDTTSSQLTAVLNIPASTPEGTITAYLYADNMNSTSYDNETITITISSDPSLSLSGTAVKLTETQNGTINVTNDGNVGFSTITLSENGEFNVSFSPASFALVAGGSQIVTITPVSTTNFFPDTLTIVAQTNTGTNYTLTSAYSVYEDFFCDYGDVNDTKVEITSIDDTSSGDEWEWKPLDEVTIDVEVENNLAEDEDFVVELAIYDTQEHSYVDIDDENALEQYVSIDEGKSEEVTFDFKVPIEMDDSDGRYVIYVKAYVDGDEDKYCNSYLATEVSGNSAGDIKITKESKEIILDDLEFSTNAKAGELVVVSTRAYNLGTSNQDDVYISLSNTKLKLDLESSKFDLDSGESKLIEFSFVVPDDAENGDYTLDLIAFFDYKKSSDYYSKESDTLTAKITVSDGTSSTTSALTGLAASLDSDSVAGEEMEVLTTITNLGTTRATFVISALDYESWATLSSISQRIVTLDAGEGQEIKITLNVKEDASGEQTFKIESRSGEKVDVKQVAVEIEDGSLLSSLSNYVGGNSMLWLIGAVNLALVLLVVFLAVRVFRR